MPTTIRLNDIVPLNSDLRSISAMIDKGVHWVRTCGRRLLANGPHESGKKRQVNVNGTVSSWITTYSEPFLTIMPHDESLVHSITWEKDPAM